jgi:cytoskeleton protein RodZ
LSDTTQLPLLADADKKVGADEATALQGGRAKNALLAVADGETALAESPHDALTVAASSHGDSAAITVGKRLRSAREAAHLTVAEVAHSLKFSPRQIELLEADDYAALPGSTIVRGFVRGYARMLKLDADDLLQILDAKAPVAPAEVRAPENMGIASEPHPRQLSPLASAAIVLALAALLLALWHWLVPSSADTIATAGSRIWSVSQLFQKPAPAPPVAPASSTREPEPVFPPTPTPMPAESVPAPQSAVPAPTSTQATATTRIPADGAGTALIFVFLERSWVEVSDATRQKLHSAQNPADSRLTLTGRPPFDIVIGNASKVSLTYDGREIDLAPYTRAEVARLTLE